MEQLGRLELAAGLGGHHRHQRLVDLGQPAVRHQGTVLAAEVVGGGVRRDVVEHPAGLRVLDVHAGEALQVAAVVAELDDPRLDPDLVAVEVGDDVELLDVEAEVVEPLDALLDPPHLARRELLLAGELAPQRLVAGLDQLHDLRRVDLARRARRWPAGRAARRRRSRSRPGRRSRASCRTGWAAARRSRRRRGRRRSRPRCGGRARWRARRRPSRTRRGGAARAARRGRRPATAGCRRRGRGRRGCGRGARTAGARSAARRAAPRRRRPRGR